MVDNNKIDNSHNIDLEALSSSIACVFANQPERWQHSFTL